MEKHINPPGKDYLIRCPRLGHQVQFGYCRSENNGLPCFKSLDCWFEHFRVEEYMNIELNKEEREKIFKKPPATKVQSLLEIIEQAKNNQ